MVRKMSELCRQKEVGRRMFQGEKRMSEDKQEGPWFT